MFWEPVAGPVPDPGGDPWPTQMDGGEEAKPVVKAEGDANVLSIKVKDQSGGEVRTGRHWKRCLALSLHAGVPGSGGAAWPDLDPCLPISRRDRWFSR